ncbi:MAG TPA: DUF1302 domain-containing protein [Lacunisphaera sp.]|nr:DUF1302 domain-containing protein [Lacunisphaera sp.]
MNQRTVIPPRLRLPSLAVLAFACAAPCAQAFVFEIGDIKGSFDTTVSVGGLYRLQNPDPALYGLTSSFKGVTGQQRSVNADDGNLNYAKGTSSFLVKANHDLQLDYKNAGLFVRGYYFNDFVNSNGTRNRTPLNDQAEKLVAEGGELLDAYVYFKPELGGTPANIRIGQQVLSWGESTFIPNGINSINSIDVAKLRTPGSELKEALLPINMASASISLTNELTLEAFYLFDWKRTRVDPPGTYFSTNDFVAKGGTKVYLGFGAIADSSGLGAIMRGEDNEPTDLGQYGFNARYLAENLNSTEFALYYMNYHSRLPTISARTPTSPVNSALIISDSAAALQANSTFLGNLAAAVGGPAGVPSALTSLIGATLTGVPASALPAPLQPFYATVAGVTGQLSQRELLVAAATGRYLIEFPEDIHLFGVSFNTNIKGVALQGELSYRSNQPVQVDDVELLFAALSPLSSRFGANNQIGSFALNTYLPGYRRVKVITGQMTATKVARGYLGADQTTFIAEAGFVNAKLPAKSTLRFDGPGTFVGGEIAYMTASGSNASGALPLSEPSSAFADEFSWGYQLVGRLDYNNVFAGVNVSPLVVFAHDVGGNTPLPLGNFLHGRKTITLGADFTFQNAWAFELRYVNFAGASRYNLLGDRDYVSATLKYSF